MIVNLLLPNRQGVVGINPDQVTHVEATGGGRADTAEVFLVSGISVRVAGPQEIVVNRLNLPTGGVVPFSNAVEEELCS